MARWAILLSPLAGMIEPLIPGSEKGRLGKIIARSLGFLRSRGVRELLPDSEFLDSLRDVRPEGAYCLSIGGTNPALFIIKGGLSVAALFKRALPEGVLPRELTVGLGDGLVTNKSSLLPFAAEHISFETNHLGVLLDPRVREAVLKRIVGD